MLFDAATRSATRDIVKLGRAGDIAVVNSPPLSPSRGSRSTCRTMARREVHSTTPRCDPIPTIGTMDAQSCHQLFPQLKVQGLCDGSIKPRGSIIRLPLHRRQNEEFHQSGYQGHNTVGQHPGEFQVFLKQQALFQRGRAGSSRVKAAMPTCSSICYSIRRASIGFSAAARRAG